MSESDFGAAAADAAADAAAIAVQLLFRLNLFLKFSLFENVGEGAVAPAGDGSREEAYDVR